VDTTETSGRITIGPGAGSQATVISNQNALNVTRTSRPSDISAQGAAVANLVSLVAVRRQLDEAVGRDVDDGAIVGQNLKDHIDLPETVG
jgi:hypothetical protein